MGWGKPIYEGGGSGRIITRKTVDTRGWFYIRPEEYVETHYVFYGWGNTERLAAEALRGSALVAEEIGKAQQYAIKDRSQVQTV